MKDKDAKKLRSANLTSNANQIVEILKYNPYRPPYKKLSGNLRSYFLDVLIFSERDTEVCSAYPIEALASFGLFDR
ncbi:hypothetical protein [Myxosarcina sp. GI1]|uniref:hypothetical protein n=1 Tax=Myxosarcina sp. GI1 TaxID=1541065 RepID=UPI001C11A725|nr:hypothetical protein [Myxosarcina sp. GI1]